MDQYIEGIPERQNFLDKQASVREFEKGWRLRTLDELRQMDHSVSFLVDGLIMQNGFTMLAASPKTGKTRLSRGLAATIAGDRRDTWLGRDVKHGPVIHVSLEDPIEVTLQHYDELEAAGDILIIENPYDKTSNPYEWLQHYITTTGAVLTVIDTVVDFLDTRGGFDPNDYVQTKEKLSEISNIARRTNSAIVGIHHNRKESAEGHRLKELMGNAAWSGVPDIVLSMGMDEGKPTLYGRGRCPDIDQVYLIEDSAGYMDVEDKVSNVKAHGLREDILEYLESAGEVTSNDICKNVRGRKERILKVLNATYVDRTINRRKEGAGFVYFL